MSPDDIVSYREALGEYAALFLTYGEAFRGGDKPSEYQSGLADGLTIAGDALRSAAEWDVPTRPATDQASFREAFPRLAAVLPQRDGGVHADTGGILNDN